MTDCGPEKNKKKQAKAYGQADGDVSQMENI